MTATLLVLRALGLGDALTAVPALKGLRALHPDHRILLAAPEPLGRWQRKLGLVDEVVPAGGLQASLPVTSRPDVAVNLHGRGPRSHRLLQALQPERLIAFGCPGAAHHGPAWPEQVHEVDRWCRLVDTAGGDCDPTDLRLPGPPPTGARGHVVVHPGAAAPSRRWPASAWRRVAEHLAARGERVVVTGTAEEAGLCAAVAGSGVEDHCGRHDLAGLSDLVARAQLVLSGDTGVAHLATAHAVPSVLLFGPMPPSSWGPRTDPHLHTVLWAPRPDDPQGDPHGARLDPRLARIRVEDVVAAAEQLLPPRGEGGVSPAPPAPRRAG